MALNGDILGADLLDAINAAVVSEPSAGPAQRAEIWKQIGRAIVAHIQLAEVTVTVTSVSGVMTGASVSGPGTGTGVIS